MPSVYSSSGATSERLPWPPNAGRPIPVTRAGRVKRGARYCSARCRTSEVRDRRARARMDLLQALADLRALEGRIRTALAIMGHTDRRCGGAAGTSGCLRLPPRAARKWTQQVMEWIELVGDPKRFSGPAIHRLSVHKCAALRGLGLDGFDELAEHISSAPVL